MKGVGENIRLDEMVNRAPKKKYALSGGFVRTAGERLSWLRRGRQLSLVQAAAISGISKTEISRLERDERTATLSHVRRLARAYDVRTTDIAELLDAQFDDLPNPKSVGTNQVVATSRESAGTTRTIPIYSADCVAREGIANARSRVLSLPTELDISADTYALQFEAGLTNPWIPPGSIAVVDPSQPARVYDLVVNTSTWSPLICFLVRPGESRAIDHQESHLVELGDRPTSLDHRVLALVYRPESWGMEINSPASSSATSG